NDNFVIFENLTLNHDLHEVSADGKTIRLTRTEYAIFKLLLKNPGQVIPKSTILDRICADTPDCTESSLKVHISNLRKKLSELGGRDYIEAVWGIGFRLKTEKS
ncbi:MAG: winged helix-turn-helix domain-containing protein, partial [Lachnospiraceae bacterium]|nr:winged helix-turn-helix domain-containing protein [Lachnospiraceae bacterium]